jgi:hypothetical protein
VWASRLWHGHFMRGDHRPSASHDATAAATASASRILDALPTATGTAAVVEGPLSPRVGRRFRKLVLERGNAAHARVLLADFLDDDDEEGGAATNINAKGVRDLEKTRRSEKTGDSTDADAEFAASVDQWVRADIEGERDRPSSSSSLSSLPRPPPTRATL